MNWKVIASAILGIIFLVVAVIYFTQPANQLPAFMPGHDATLSAKHMKHGIGSVIVALAFFAFAWFQSGKKKTTSSPAKNEE